MVKCPVYPLRCFLYVDYPSVYLSSIYLSSLGFLGSTVERLCLPIAGDRGLIPELGRSTPIGNGNPLQYSCLGNSIDRGAWRATVHGVAKNWT